MKGKVRWEEKEGGRKKGLGIKASREVATVTRSWNLNRIIDVLTKNLVRVKRKLIPGKFVEALKSMAKL